MPRSGKDAEKVVEDLGHKRGVQVEAGGLVLDEKRENGKPFSGQASQDFQVRYLAEELDRFPERSNKSLNSWQSIKAACRSRYLEKYSSRWLMAASVIVCLR